MSNKFSSECLHFFVCLFTFFVFVFSSLFKTFKELEKRLMHCEYHHCISASQSSEWFMICSNIFFDYNWNGPLSHLGPWLFRPPRNLVPSWESFYDIFMQGKNFQGPKVLRDQKSQGPKCDRGPFQLQPIFCLEQSQNTFVAQLWILYIQNASLIKSLLMSS